MHKFSMKFHISKLRFALTMRCLLAPAAWQEAGPFSGRRAMHCGVKEEVIWSLVIH
jgi:hypothetical protein